MLNEEQKKQIAALRKQGSGYKKVAQILDISVDSVKYYCRKNALTGKIQPKAATEGICLKCGKQLVQPEKRKRRPRFWLNPVPWASGEPLTAP